MCITAVENVFIPLDCPPQVVGKAMHITNVGDVLPKNVSSHQGQEGSRGWSIWNQGDHNEASG